MSNGDLNAGFIESLPPVLLDTLAAGQPPPGVSANFEHPTTLVPAILSVLVIFLFTATTTYGVRLYMKTIYLKNWRWDDTMVTVGFLFTLIYLAGNICGSEYGIIGYHLWDIHLNRAISQAGLNGTYLTLVTITPSLGFVKLSFLVQFYYLFKPLRWLRLLCWFGGGFIAFVYLGISITAFVLNSPWHGEDMLAGTLSWHHLAFVNLTIPTGVVSLVTDLFVLVLPVPAVMGLQMALRKKIGVLLVFALGILAVVGSTMSLYYRILLIQNANTNEADSGFMAGYIAIWTQVELLAGITAANMLVVHQFLVRKNILSRIWSGRFSTTLRSLLSMTRTTKSTEKDDTYALTDSFASNRDDTKVASQTSKSNGWKRGHPGTQILVSQDYTVISHEV